LQRAPLAKALLSRRPSRPPERPEAPSSQALHSMKEFPMRSFRARWRIRTASPAAPRPVSRPSFEQLEDRLVSAVTYHGGPLLQNVGVEALFYGAGWQNQPALTAQANDLANFLTAMTDGPYLDMLQNAGYGVGRGAYLGGAILPADLSAGTLDDSQ